MRNVLISLGLFLLVAACTPTDPTPKFSKQRIVVPPAGQMAAGYFELENPGSEPLRILSVTASAFRMAEIHQTVVVDGMSRMREVKNVEVPAKSLRRFEPGGWHIMLMGYRQDPTAQSSLPVEIEWRLGEAPAQRTTLEFKTQSAGEAG